MKFSLQPIYRHLSPINLLLMAGLVWLTFSSAAYGADVTLAWDASYQETLAGYKIYYDGDIDSDMYQGTGATEGDAPITVYLEDLDDPDAPQFTLTDLENGQYYYFAVTAFGNDGNESAFSEEVGILFDAAGDVASVSNTQTDDSLTDSSLTDNSLTDSSLTDSSLTDSSLTDTTGDSQASGGGGGGGCFITGAMDHKPAGPMAGAVGILLLLGIAAMKRPGIRNPGQDN